MKQLRLYQGVYGQFFFDPAANDLLVQYIHENDGPVDEDWR